MVKKPRPIPRVDFCDWRSRIRLEEEGPVYIARARHKKLYCHRRVDERVIELVIRPRGTRVFPDDSRPDLPFPHPPELDAGF